MNKRALHSVIMTLLLLALSACAGTSGGRIDTNEDISQALDEKQQGSAAPAEVAADMMPANDPALAFDEPDLEPRFDVNADRVGARNFFMGLVKGTDYNMVVHPDVSGDISLTLKNVTVPEVMAIVRDLYGYDYRSSRQGFMVLPATMQSRIYQVNYLNLNRSGKSETRVSSGQLAGGSEEGSQGSQSGVFRNNASNVQVKPSTKIETEGGSDFWPELRSALEAIVGGENRKVVINAQTGVILVRAMPDEHRHVAEYLASIQDSAQRQVVLEAKIIEVELKEGFQSGINWAALDQSGDRTVLGGMVGGSELFEDGGSSALGGQSVTLEPGGTPITTLPTSLFGGVFGLAVNTSDFSAFIELLETQGDAKVLSSPRVATVNNQKAVIKVGSDEFFVTGIQSNTTTGTATNTNNTVLLTPFFSGIALDVTPQISEDGEVILHVHPSVSEVTDQRKTITLGEDSGQLPLAFSTVRESDSVIRARNGQIVVIGGLMKSSTTTENASVPLLGDIPLLGNLFKHKREREVKSELIILLRPIVISSDDDWDSVAGDARSHFVD